MAISNNKNDSFILTSMTDLMTSLAVIFILLLVVYLNNAGGKSKNIKSELEKQLLAQNIHAEPDHFDPLSLIIRLHDDTLSFNIDRTDIKSDGMLFLQDFIPKLSSVICSNMGDVESILVQGFTDSKTGAYSHNLDLSQKRAFNVLMYAINHTNLSKDHKDCLLELTSTNGKGSKDLLPFDNIHYTFAKPGFEDENLSRRVEFKIRVKSYEQREKIKQLRQSKQDS